MKRSITTQVSSVLRIVRGERDALVRTTHFKAAVENVSIATIERTIMSTKTTFKRVALIAVAAVGLGLLSAAPSSAGSTTEDPNVSMSAPHIEYMKGLATGTIYARDSQVIGGQATVKIYLDTSSAATDAGAATTNVIIIGGVGSVVSTTLSKSAGAAPVTTGYVSPYTTWTDSVSAGIGQAGYDTIVLTSTVIGEQTVSYKVLNATTGTAGTAVTKTIYWLAAATDGTYVSSTAYLGTGSAEAGTGGYATPATTAQKATGSSATFSTAAVANVVIRQYASGDTTTVLLAASAKAMVVSISGAGAVDAAATSVTTRGTSTTTAAETANNADFFIFPDGRTGVATITATVGGVTVGTWTWNFFGTATAIKADPDADDVTYSVPKSLIAIGGTDTLYTIGTDVNGNKATCPSTLAVESSNVLIATVSQSSCITTVTGVAEGKATLTYSVGAIATATIKYTRTVTVTSPTVKTTTIAFNKASYGPGEKMTLTVTSKNAAGSGISDGTRTLFTTALSGNVALAGSTLPATLTAVLTNGSKDYIMYAPLVAGTVTVSGADLDAVTISASATVSNPDADAALDAANEATDAANYAADAADAATTAAEEATAAAQAAQESADAALAAVTDLGVKVAALVGALKAQITALTNIIVKIQKKMKA